MASIHATRAVFASFRQSCTDLDFLFDNVELGELDRCGTEQHKLYVARHELHHQYKLELELKLHHVHPFFELFDESDHRVIGEQYGRSDEQLYLGLGNHSEHYWLGGLKLVSSRIGDK